MSIRSKACNYIQITVFLVGLLYGCNQIGKKESITEELLQNEVEVYPEIGKPCPDFVLEDLQYYHDDAVALNDLKGKPVILDFFATGCASCFASFPKINRLQQDFRDELQFILVGKDDRYIRKTYEKFRAKQNLELVVAYDSVLNKNWVKYGYPHLIWIDGEGIVRAITGSSDANAENIRAFLDNRGFKFNDQSVDAVKKSRSAVNLNKPLLVNDNGGQRKSFIYRSVLAEWDTSVERKIPTAKYGVRSRLRKYGSFQATGISIYELFNFAYLDRTSQYTRFADSLYGEFYVTPLLEIQDASRFEPDFDTGKNLYTYSIKVPEDRATPEIIRKFIREDLQRYFGLSAKTETRKMPYWALEITGETADSLQTGGGEPSLKGSHSGYSWKNTSINKVLTTIYAYHQAEPPFIDETGIKGPIDVTINAMFTDLDDIRKELEKSGLRLVKKEKKMKVLIIKKS